MKKLFLLASLCMAASLSARESEEVRVTDGPSVPESVVVDAAPAQEVYEDDVVFIRVETKASFPGGKGAMRQYLKDNIKYPEQAFKDSVQGNVLVSFVVNRDGSICDVQVVRSSNSQLLDDEAVRVVKIMPKWKPGIQGNKTVRQKFTLPVTFKLPDSENK